MSMQNLRWIWLIGFLLAFGDVGGQDWRTLYASALKSYEANDLPNSYSDASKALESYLKESGEQSDNYASILRLLQNICYADNKFPEGLEFATKEVLLRTKVKDIKYGNALSQQGMFYQALGDFTSAGQSFRESYDILAQFLPDGNFELAESKVTIGVNAYLSSDISAARKIFSETLSKTYEQVTPVFIQAYFFFGVINQESGDLQAALKNFEEVKPYYEALEPSVEHARLLTNIGLCYHGLNQLDKAEAAYEKAFALFASLKEQGSDYISALNARAINFQKMGQVEKAEKLFAAGEGSGDVTTSATLFSNKASVSATRGEYNEAEKFYRLAVSKLDNTKPDHRPLCAEILYNLAVMYNDISRESEAETVLADAGSLLTEKDAASTAALLRIKTERANIYSETGRFNEAMGLFAEVLAADSKNGTEFSRQSAKAISGLALLYYRKGDIQSADSAFRVVLDRYNSGVLRRDEVYAALLNNFAAVKQTKGEYSIARKLLKEAADHFKKTSGVLNIGYTRALENLGYIDLDIGALTTAKTEIDSALLLYQNLLGSQSLAYGLALISKGKYHQNAGEYTLAEPCFRNAFQLVVASKGAPEESWVKAANALALYYQTMGNYEQAEPLFKEMLLRIEKTIGKNSPEYSTTLQNLATLYQLLDKLDLARPLLEEALSIDKKVFGDQHPKYIIALRNLAAVYQKTGKKENAKILLELALSTTKSTFGDNHPSIATTLSNLGALYQDLGNMKDAEKAWAESVAIRKRLLGEQHPDYARSLYGLATVYFGQGKMKEANDHYRLVISQYLHQITEYFPALSEKEKGAFYQKIKPVFDSYQDFCIQYYKQNPAQKDVLTELYRIQLLTKAILLNSSNKVRQTILSSGDAQLVDVFRKWLEAKELIVHYFSLSAEEKKQFPSIDQLTQKANDLEKQLSVSSALFRSHFVEKEYNARDISELLQPGEAAIEVLRIQRKFVKDSIYYVALILKHGSESPSLVIWPYGQKLENRFFRFHRNAIKYHFRDTISYNYYWKPLSKELTSIRKLYLSADGIFNKINFNIIQNNTNHHWVLDDYEIHLLSNTKEILEHASRKPSPHHEIHLYGYADFHLKFSGIPAASLHAGSLNRNFGFTGEIPMLPGTQIEISEIGKLFATQQYQIKSYQVQEASESNIKKTPHVKVLHIATHGFFMNDIEVSESEGDDKTDFFNNPLLRSGILLAGAGVSKSESDLSGEDGILTAYEAMNIDLNETDLVVLSACETALGELKNGEGVYGLQRSFIVAGAEAVIMSLWQVDDVATQELMVNFYQHWLNGQPKHEAFRNAQLMVKEKYSSPFFWGAFILVGE
jgi:CHAT domain-containing protein/Tfp pilus assembly protein PilF